jgi:hypothetical protein
VTIIKNGDRVAYARKFLRSVGAITHDIASRRGTVLDADGVLVRVRWDDTRKPAPVLKSNLVPANRLHLEPA